MRIVELALRGSHESYFEKIFLGEDAFVKDKPKEGGDFGPGFVIPYLGLAWIGSLIRDVGEMVCLFCGEHAFGFISPA